MSHLYEDLDSAFSALYDYSCEGGSYGVDEDDNPKSHHYKSVNGMILMELSRDCLVTTITVGDEFRVVRNLDWEDWYHFVAGDEESFIAFVSELIPPPKNTWHHTCEKCYKQNSSVSMIYDPFEYDINNREVVLATLCSDCFSEDYDLQQKLHDLAMEV